METDCYLCGHFPSRFRIRSSTLLHIFTCVMGSFVVPGFCHSEPGSSFSIVSGYGLDDREIEVQSPTEEKEFFL
jgi:hypothetical protein